MKAIARNKYTTFPGMKCNIMLLRLKLLNTIHFVIFTYHVYTSANAPDQNYGGDIISLETA